MVAKTFRGGVHMDEHKNTEHSQIEKLPAPERVYIPMSRHIGAHCNPVVALGDTVNKGQLIGSGLLTVFIRRFGGYPDGVSFAVLIMNLLVWYIDKFTKPVKFGGITNGKKQ